MVPAVAHFVWIGRRVSFMHWVALATAAKRGGFSDVVFHHTDELDDDVNTRSLAELPGVRLSRLDPLSLLEEADARLVDVYRDLSAPAAQSNVLRVALLFRRGGVYLDTDTVTLASFSALSARAGLFCGEERLVFPASGQSFLASRLKPAAVARMLARDVCRRAPSGYRWFRQIEHLYPRAVNNAVIGAEAGHAFLEDLIARMIAVPRERRRVRFAFGTHLLQKAVRESRAPGVEVLGPHAFYPLGPEISEHWFKPRPDVRLDDAIGPDTLLVHWYASVRTAPYVARIDSVWIREHANSELFSALVSQALGS
jgi:hypothetical protein